MLRIEEITTLDELLALRKEWNEVLERSKDNNIFLTWEITATCAKNLERTKKIRILCVKDGDRIVSIAPLRKSRYKLDGLLGYDVLEPITYRRSDYTGFVVAEQEEASLKLIINHLFEQKDWDFIYLLDVPETSLIFKLLPKIAADIPRFAIEEGRPCPYIVMPSSMDILLSSLSAKFRKNLRRSMKSLKSDYQRVELKRYDEFGSMEEAMNTFFTLHQKRWATKGKPGVYKDNKTRDASIELSKLYAEKGWLALYFLTANDKPVAAQYCLEYGQRMHYGLGGFDPDYSKYSVGNLITGMVLEKCIERNIREYDFMKGNESYKFDWTTKCRRNLGIRFVNKKFSSKLFHFGVKGIKEMKLDSLLERYFQI
jgi:CelD/BcsL family acetyltransferase involved in cellulose biosynthesis